MTTRKRAPRASGPNGVYAKLRHLIVNSVLAPGSPLIERPLAERLGVSRSSLRSAIQRLEHEGLVQSTPAGSYSRSIVAPLTVADIQEIYTLKAVLNGAAARIAAELPETDRKRIADEMQVLNDELAQVLDSPSEELDESYDIDDRLHLCYIATAGPRLRSIYSAINTQGERYGRAYASVMGHAAIVRGPASTSPSEHQRIINAILAGDPDSAEREARKNWQNAAARLKKVIASVGERGSF